MRANKSLHMGASPRAERLLKPHAKTCPPAGGAKLTLPPFAASSRLSGRSLDGNGRLGKKEFFV